MTFWRLFYHLVWAARERRPLITPEIEPELYGYIIGKADSLGAIIHAIGGTEDHIHLVASIPPALSVADFVQGIKGSSAHYINRVVVTASKFGWQRGYGVFSISEKQLADTVAYVKNQKPHHQQRRTIAALEQMGGNSESGP